MRLIIHGLRLTSYRPLHVDKLRTRNALCMRMPMQVRSAMDMFRAMDPDADGKVTRKDMLCAFKRNRQTADILKFPHIVRQWDGTWERFLDQFLSVS